MVFNVTIQIHIYCDGKCITTLICFVRKSVQVSQECGTVN